MSVENQKPAVPTAAQLANRSDSSLNVSETATPEIRLTSEPMMAEDFSTPKYDEHIITINECPVCHQPRLRKRSEVDIITHLATCASRDWRQVDALSLRGFVTSDQAKRKWYTNVTIFDSLICGYGY